jgi:hypothetical protein
MRASRFADLAGAHASLSRPRLRSGRCNQDSAFVRSRTVPRRVRSHIITRDTAPISKQEPLSNEAAPRTSPADFPQPRRRGATRSRMSETSGKELVDTRRLVRGLAAMIAWFRRRGQSSSSHAAPIYARSRRLCTIRRNPWRLPSASEARTLMLHRRANG